MVYSWSQVVERERRRKMEPCCVLGSFVPIHHSFWEVYLLLVQKKNKTPLRTSLSPHHPLYPTQLYPAIRLQALLHLGLHNPTLLMTSPTLSSSATEQN